MPTSKSTAVAPLKSLQVTRFYVVVPADSSSEKVIDSLESAQNAALAFVNARSLPVAAVETTQINGVVCCSVWYRANAPIDPAAPIPAKPKPKPTKPKAKLVKSDSNSSSSSSSSVASSSVPPVSQSLAEETDSAAASDAGAYSFAPSEEGDIELKERAPPAADSTAAAKAVPKKKKPTLTVPAKYQSSSLRVGMKNVVLSAGDSGDAASVQVICHLGDATTEHLFIAKKTTLAALGFADMEEGTVNIKELVLLSLHYIVDDAKTQLADIPRQLSPEQLHELFPAYTKNVAKPGSQAASADGCIIQ